MVEIFRLPLFAALVGLAFSVGFAPWLARRWQDRQREREVRYELVADMAQCIMSLVAVLERRHPGTRALEVAESRSLIAPSRGLRRANPRATIDREAELAKAILTFDIERCVIGTKLETYFLSHSLATRWTRFADELILFSAGSISDDPAERLYRDSGKNVLQARKYAAARAAKERSAWVEVGWGGTEQLFLAQKREFLTSVRMEPMTQLPSYPESSIRYFMWSSISFASVCLALVGMDIANRGNQPVGEAGFAVLGGVATILGIILLILGLKRRKRPPESPTKRSWTAQH